MGVHDVTENIVNEVEYLDRLRRAYVAAAIGAYQVADALLKAREEV